MTTAALLVAAGQLPAAGHAHSGGIEGALQAGLLDGVDSLRQLLTARLAGAGLVAAGIAAAAVEGAAGVAEHARVVLGAAGRGEVLFEELAEGGIQRWVGAPGPPRGDS